MPRIGLIYTTFGYYVDLDDEDMVDRADANIRDAFKDPECVDEILIEEAPDATYKDIPDFLKEPGEPKEYSLTAEQEGVLTLENILDPQVFKDFCKEMCETNGISLTKYHFYDAIRDYKDWISQDDD